MQVNQHCLDLYVQIAVCCVYVDFRIQSFARQTWRDLLCWKWNLGFICYEMANITADLEIVPFLDHQHCQSLGFLDKALIYRMKAKRQGLNLNLPFCSHPELMSTPKHTQPSTQLVHFLPIWSFKLITSARHLFLMHKSQKTLNLLLCGSHITFWLSESRTLARKGSMLHRPF